MFKERQVIEWAKETLQRNHIAVFTAGQCAKGCNVSVNTAKKYLKKAVSDGGWMAVYYEELPNGVTVAIYCASDGCEHAETITRGWIASGDIINTQYICRDCGKVVRWTEQQNAYAGWVGSTSEIKEREI